MHTLSDAELLNELENHFAQTRLAMEELSAANASLIAMNEKLRDSEALKSNFLSNIRNEINNPLSSIMLLASRIQWGLEEGHPLGQAAAVIHEEAQNLNFQLNNFIAAADLEAGDCSASLEEVDVGTILQNIADTFVTPLARKQLHLSLPKEPAGSLVFFTDAAILALILANLVDNAIKFSNKGESIAIMASCTATTLTLTVSDTGIGIAPEDQQRIFDRFEQIERGSTRTHRGHGLGLSIVKALVELLNGTLTITSSTGKGTSIAVSLPKPEFTNEVDIFAEDGNLFIFGDTTEK